MSCTVSCTVTVRLLYGELYGEVIPKSTACSKRRRSPNYFILFRNTIIMSSQSKNQYNCDLCVGILFTSFLKL